MSITFECPECGLPNEQGDRFAGCVVLCRQCDRSVVVPSRDFQIEVAPGRRIHRELRELWIPLNLVALCLAVVPYLGSSLMLVFPPDHALQWLGPSLIIIGTPIAMILSTLAVYRDRSNSVARLSIALSVGFIVLILALVLISVVVWP
jgi:hypothetical protein